MDVEIDIRVLLNIIRRALGVAVWSLWEAVQQYPNIVSKGGGLVYEICPNPQYY